MRLPNFVIVAIAVLLAAMALAYGMQGTHGTSLAAREAESKRLFADRYEAAKAASIKSAWEIAVDEKQTPVRRLEALDLLEKAEPAQFQARGLAALYQPLRDAKKRADDVEAKAEAKRQKVAAAERKAYAKSRGVNLGASKQEVLDSAWGKPSYVNTTIHAWGTSEQWVYRNMRRGYLYFEGDVLTSIQY